jgi:hypothetical protein
MAGCCCVQVKGPGEVATEDLFDEHALSAAIPTSAARKSLLIVLGR